MGVPPLGCGQEVTMAVLPRATVTFLFTDTWCGSHEGRLIPAAAPVEDSRPVRTHTPRSSPRRTRSRRAGTDRGASPSAV
jgi:hypothetical protein